MVWCYNKHVQRCIANGTKLFFSYITSLSKYFLILGIVACFTMFVISYNSVTFVPYQHCTGHLDSGLEKEHLIVGIKAIFTASSSNLTATVDTGTLYSPVTTRDYHFIYKIVQPESEKIILQWDVIDYIDCDFPPMYIKVNKTASIYGVI